MRIPTGPNGLPTLRTQHIRTYGAGGFRMNEQEEVQGCPRQYKAKYVDHSVAAEKRSDALLFGTTFHQVLYAMEEHTIGPEEAMERAWPAGLSLERWSEMKADLESYMTRGGPMNRLSTVAIEQDLFAPLYTDEDFGEIWFGGKLDWLGVDVNDMGTLHVVDYKTNRFPPSLEDVKSDVQLMSYAWLAMENWSRLMTTKVPNVVVHLDAVKWREIEWRYGDDQMADWHDWAIAIARQILRDTEGRPSVGPGCGWCPIKLDCPAYKNLPGDGLTLAERRVSTSLEQRVQWAQEAAATIKILRAGVAEVDAAIDEAVRAEGELSLAGAVYTLEPSWSTVLDKWGLFQQIGPEAYLSVSSVAKTAMTEYIGRHQEYEKGAEQIMACWSREPSGDKVTRKKE